MSNIVDASTPTPSVDDSRTTEQVPANEVPTEIEQTVTNPELGLTGVVTDGNNKLIPGAKVEDDPTTGRITVTIPKGVDPSEATVIITNGDGTIKYRDPIRMQISSPESGGSSQGSSDLDGRCIAPLVGWSLPLLALIPVGTALNAGIPVVEEAMRPVNEQLAQWNSQIQPQLGLYNEQLAG